MSLARFEPWVRLDESSGIATLLALVLVAMCGAVAVLLYLPLR